jgi:hypothetical protein
MAAATKIQNKKANTNVISAIPLDSVEKKTNPSIANKKRNAISDTRSSTTVARHLAVEQEETRDRYVDLIKSPLLPGLMDPKKYPMSQILDDSFNDIPEFRLCKSTFCFIAFISTIGTHNKIAVKNSAGSAPARLLIMPLGPIAHTTYANSKNPIRKANLEYFASCTINRAPMNI